MSMRPVIYVLALLGVVQASSFHEALTLRPTQDGKLSVHFEFTTTFQGRQPSEIPTSHHSLTPPSLLLPLEKNNVSSMTMSFVSGRWESTWGLGPLETQSGGGGGEVRGWLKQEDPDAWIAATHALGGLFCAGLGPTSPDETTSAFAKVFPGAGYHFYTPTPPNQLCTENLTPFLKLLPSKGLSGLSKLLANPGVVMAWGFRSEGIEVVMPESGRDGYWRGWWEGVVDLVPHRGGSRDFSIETLFKSSFARPFPLASSSTLRLIGPHLPRASPGPGSTSSESIDGEEVNIQTWDLRSFAEPSISFSWDEETFAYVKPSHPGITIHRSLIKPHAADGSLLIKIVNAGPERLVGYTEMLPWWLKTWVSEIATTPGNLIQGIDYTPSIPSIRPTTLLMTLTLPSNTTTYLSIPYTKQTIKYTEHQPDAERGVEIPSGTLVFLDGDQSRPRIYTAKSLLDLPTPDFSMPYNVIIMTCTVLALFFGSVFNLLGRKWGVVVLK